VYREKGDPSRKIGVSLEKGNLKGEKKKKGLGRNHRRNKKREWGVTRGEK